MAKHDGTKSIRIKKSTHDFLVKKQGDFAKKGIRRSFSEIIEGE